MRFPLKNIRAINQLDKSRFPPLPDYGLMYSYGTLAHFDNGTVVRPSYILNSRRQHIVRAAPNKFFWWKPGFGEVLLINKTSPMDVYDKVRSQNKK